MKKINAYLISLLVILLSAANGWAQLPVIKSETGRTFYAGVSLDNTGNYGGGIVSFKKDAPYTKPMSQLTKQKSMIGAGAMAQGKYYAMCTNPDTGMPTDFCTINFNTGETTVLGNATAILSMTYDEKAKVMYGLGRSEIGSVLYSIDLTNGNVTEIIDTPQYNFVGIVATPYNVLYAMSSNGKLYSIIPESKTINERGNLQGNIKPDYKGQSLVFEDGTLYWLAYAREGSSTTPTCILATINNINLEVTKIGNAAESFENGKLYLNGLCLTDPKVDEEELLSDIFYAAVSDNDDMFGGGIINFNRKNPYETVKHTAVNDYFVGAGAMAEGVYYAMCTEDYGDEPGDFCSMNLETGDVTVLGKATLLYSMTYDDKNKIMYAVEQPENGNGSVIYTVNLSNGTLTSVKNFDELYIVSIAVGSDGTFYAMSDESELCTLNLKDGTHRVIGSTGITIDRNSQQSMAFNKNTLYWLFYGFTENKAGTIFATIDQTSGVATLVKPGTFSQEVPRLTGLCFPHKSEEPAGAYKVTTIKTYGSDLGDVPQGQYARLQTNYYDKNNNLVRSSMKGVKNGTEVADIPSIYTVYNHNEKGQVVETYTRQYGLYDGMDYAFSEPKFTSTYEYDTNGNLSRYFDGSRNDTTYYEWAGNNLVKETLVHLRNGTTDDYYQMYQITYSDFLEGAGNCPRKMKSSSSKFTNYDFSGIYTYNEQNLKTSFITVTLPEEKNRSKQEWKYDKEGRLTEELSYETNQAGEFVLTTHVIYTIDGHETKIQTEGFPSYLVETKSTCDGATAPVNLTVKDVSTPASPNTYALSCDIPTGIDNTHLAWDIYRDGEKVKRVTELINGKIQYTEKMIKNGMYDYFIQTINLENGEETLNVSNPVTIRVSTELPPARDIKYVSHRTEGGDEAQNNLVTISWSAPSGSFEVLGYNVFLGPNKRPANNETLITGTTAEINFGLAAVPGNLKQNIVVETVYKIGKIKTEPVLIDLTADNIEKEQIESLIEFNNGCLLLKEENVSVEIYNVNGTMTGSFRNTPIVNLETLLPGVYLIKVGHNEKTTTIKFIKR